MVLVCRKTQDMCCYSQIIPTHSVLFFLNPREYKYHDFFSSMTSLPPKSKKILTQLPEIIKASKQTTIHQASNRNHNNLNVNMIYKKVDVMKLTYSQVTDMEFVSAHAFQPCSSCYSTKVYSPKQDALDRIAKEMGIGTDRKEAKERFWVWRLETFGNWRTPEEARQTLKNEYPDGIPNPTGFKVQILRDDD
jgi:hypothetical protein